MSARDELAKIIAERYHAAHDGITVLDRAIADAILAAGYRKPQQVTTAEELDALPIGKVVILRDSKHEPHPAQKGEHGWRLPFVDDFWTSAELLAGSTASAELVDP